MLRCTKKLLDVICPEQLATQEPDGSDWYGNLLVLDRRKCLLLTHVDSLFTIFEPDVRAPDLRSTHDLVAWLIERELLAEGLPVRTFGDLGTEELSIAKTADRSVLGSPLRSAASACSSTTSVQTVLTERTSAICNESSTSCMPSSPCTPPRKRRAISRSPTTLSPPYRDGVHEGPPLVGAGLKVGRSPPPRPSIVRHAAWGMYDARTVSPATRHGETRDRGALRWRGGGCHVLPRHRS